MWKLQSFRLLPVLLCELYRRPRSNCRRFCLSRDGPWIWDFSRAVSSRNHSNSWSSWCKSICSVTTKERKHESPTQLRWNPSQLPWDLVEEILTWPRQISSGFCRNHTGVSRLSVPADWPFWTFPLSSALWSRFSARWLPRMEWLSSLDMLDTVVYLEKEIWRNERNGCGTFLRWTKTKNRKVAFCLEWWNELIYGSASSTDQSGIPGVHIYVHSVAKTAERATGGSRLIQIWKILIPSYFKVLWKSHVDLSCVNLPT